MSNSKTLTLLFDIGGTTIKCALLNNGEIYKKFEIITKIGHVINNLYDKTIEYLHDLNLKISNINYIACTVCGPYDHEKGISIWSGNLRFDNYPFLKNMKKIFEMENIFVLNDSKAATYGEWMLGFGNDKPKSMMLYTIGTGIGGGLIYNNTLVFGDITKLASEPGHGGGFHQVYNCNCGLNGCVESLSSATGIEKYLNKIKNKSKGYLKELMFEFKNKNIKIKDINNDIGKSDNEIIDAFKFCLEPLANHIAMTIHLIEPEIIVIGGGPSKLGNFLLNILNELINNRVLSVFKNKFNVKIANLGNDAGILGINEWAKKIINNDL